MQDLQALALDWHHSGHGAGQGAVMATVIETWGSAPRGVGAQMLVRGDGAFAGSVSGGCVEGAVIAEAQAIMAGDAPKVLEYGVADENAFAVGLACGGTIKILLEPVGTVLPVALLRDWVHAHEARQAVSYVVDIHSGVSSLSVIAPDAFGSSQLAGSQFKLHDLPRPRLCIIGAVHIAQALYPMAQAAGFDVHIIDPRPIFASETRFADVARSVDWPAEALAQQGLDARTAVVTLTHDPKIDEPALEAALHSDAFYIGCLGSNRTHAARLDRLGERFTAQQLTRLHGPVGLPIGAKTPAEIAVSIMAQLIGVLRG